MENKEGSIHVEKEDSMECMQTHDEGGIPVSDDEENNINDPDQVQKTSKEVILDETQNESLSMTINTVDEMSIAGEISKYIHSNRINLGELENSMDMWAICDAISAAHSGLPDSLLREAFLLVLEGFYSFAQNNPWMRKHLDYLSRIWKREMLSEKSTNRPTKFVASNAEIVLQKETMAESVHPTDNESTAHHLPIPSVTEEDENNHHQKAHGQEGPDDSLTVTGADVPSLKTRRQRRQVAKRKRALAVMMGVGQMLKQARRTLNTETGQLDVDEDEFGNFSIGGTELTFESWGKINATNQSDVVYIGDQQQQQQKEQQQQQREERSAKKRQDDHYDEKEKTTENKTKTEKSSHFEMVSATATPTTEHLKDNVNESNRATEVPLLEGMAKRYPTVAEVEMPSLTDENQRLRPTAVIKGASKNERKAAKIERKQKRLEEKDEGELSSSDSEEATSSEEESMASSADEAAAHRQSSPQLVVSRARRRMRRVDEQKQGVSSAQNLQALLRKCFELRSRIVGKLSIGQKAMFRDCLDRSISGTLQQQPQQHDLQQIIHSMAKPFDGSAGMFPL